MEKQSFIALVKRYYPWICSMEKAAFRIHDDVNQKYDHVLPYGFHLKMTVSYVSRYGYLVAETEADILILYASRGIQNQYIRLGLSYQISVARDIRYRHFQMKSIRQHMIIFLIHIIMYTKSSLLHTADPRIITLY